MANKANLANSVLFAPLSDSDTTLEVYTGDGALFPAVPFYMTISPKNKWSRKINSEIVEVTAVVGDTFTITRAQKGTTAMEFSYGDLVANGIYVEDLTETKDEAVSQALQAMMPVGFVVTLGVSTNPATLYGFGTWAAIAGRVVVGIDSGQTEFDTLNETGGAKTHTLTVAQMPAHKHAIRRDNTSGDAGYLPAGAAPNSVMSNVGGHNANMRGTFNDRAGTDYSNGGELMQNTGGGGAHNNLQPYIVKYVWERTA